MPPTRVDPGCVARALLLLLALLALPGGAARAGEQQEEEQEESGPGAVHQALLYLPNRLFDALDPFRLRVRVGPGVAVGVRATEFADLYVGSYAALYAGLPGPRMRRLPRLPVGFENNHGVEISVVDASSGFGLDPGYSRSEFGLGFQILLVGVDVGFDPVELVDFVAGLFLFDPRGDDL